MNVTEVSTEDLAARLGAIEFMIRQLYSAQLKARGVAPKELVLAAQGQVMVDLRDKVESEVDLDKRARMQKTVAHINRIYEELVRRCGTPGPCEI